MKKRISNKTIFTKGEIFGLILGLVVLTVIISGIASYSNNYMALYPDSEIVNVIVDAMNKLPTNPKLALPWNVPNILEPFGLSAMIIAFVAMGMLNNRQMHNRKGEDYGSARWHDDIKGYILKFTKPYGKKGMSQTNGDLNQVLSDNIYLGMDGSKTYLNNITTVFGGSGTGKSRFFVKPNILQANDSYVITDPSGELYRDTGKFLEDEGYDVKVFNLSNMAASGRYNPFEYIRDEQGILTMIKTFINNTNNGKSGGDPFWDKTEETLLSALSFYIYYCMPKEEQTFNTLKDLLDLASVDEDDANVESDLDKVFNQIRTDSNASEGAKIALKFYDDFKIAAGKTLKSILITCKTRMSSFNISNVRNLVDGDDLDLTTIGDKNTALFVMIPVADKTYNFLVAMMYSQLFESLYFKAENSDKGRLDKNVSFYLDEFANIGKIHEFEEKVATMRKYGLNVKIILQSLSQLKAMYKDTWDGLLGNCDSIVYLGGQDQDTAKWVSAQLGKETINVENRSKSDASKRNRSLNNSLTGRDLLMPDEVSKIPNDKCIVFIRTQNPFFDDKFKYEKHRNFKYTADSDSKNIKRLDIKTETSNRDNKVSNIIGEPISQEKDLSMSKMAKETYMNNGGQFTRTPITYNETVIKNLVDSKITFTNEDVEDNYSKHFEIIESNNIKTEEG